MERAEFLRNALLRTPQEYRRFAPVAAEWVANQLGTDARHFPYVTSAAAMLASAAAEGARGAQLIPVVVTTESAILSRMLASWARPLAEQVRTEIFGTSTPPFGSIAEGRDWLLAQGPSDPGAPSGASPIRDFEARMERVHAEVAEINEAWTEHEVTVHRRGCGIGYPLEDGSVGTVTATTTQLRTLWTAAERMAVEAGWAREQASMFILVGAEPALPPVRVRTRGLFSMGPPTWERLERRWIEVEILARDLTFDHLKGLFRSLRTQGASRKKPLRERDRQVWEFVKRHRPDVPWKDVLDLWNREHPKWPYGSVRGMEKVVTQVEKRISSG